MFEKVILRRSEDGKNISLGMIAEALLFYQHVHLILDFATLKELLLKIDMWQLFRLLARNDISAVYCDEVLSIETREFSWTKIHDFVGVTIASDEKGNDIGTVWKRLAYHLEKAGYYDKSTIKIFIEQFRRHVKATQFTSNEYVSGGVTHAARQNLNDTPFVYEAVRQALVSLTGMPSVLGEFKFEVIVTNSGFHIITDLDFRSINASRIGSQPTLECISEAHLVSPILEATADMILAAHDGGEFYTSALSSKIIRLRHEQLLTHTERSIDEIDRFFKEVVLNGCPALRECIDEGSRDFEEFLKVLDQSKTFREWVRDKSPDQTLITCYVQEVTAPGCLQKLPVKVVRYVIALALANVEPELGIAYSVADSFLIDKIRLGWRPNHFINDALKPFLHSKNG